MKFPASVVAVLAALGLVSCGGGHHHTSGSASHQYKYQTQRGPSAHSPTFGIPPKGLTLPRPAVGVPTAEMFDTVTLSTVPFNPRALAGYTAGFWPTYLPLVRAYPHAVVKSIAISVRYHAMCLDVEPGDAVPSQSAGWVRADLAAGFRKPCIYTSLGQMALVRANLAANGIARSQVFLWDANWTFVRHLDSGYDATQWTDRALGRNLDESTVSLAFLAGGKPTPARLVCFGKHAKTHNRTCILVVQNDGRWHRALRSSQGAYVARGCPPLAQRVRWFSARLHGPKKAHRKGALVASRRAYRQRDCAVFNQRVRYFNGRVVALEKKYR